MAKKTGFHIEIVPDMYELGIFKKTLSSSRRLRWTAAIAIFSLFAAFLVIGFYIRYWSTCYWVNMILVLLLYLSVLIVSYLLALVIGDLLFAGPWRQKMMLGPKFVPDDLGSQKALLRNRSYYFVLVWCFSLVVLGLGSDVLTGGNMRWFHSVGGILVSMRSSDESERTQVMKAIAHPIHDTNWLNPEIRELTVQMILDSNDDVRGYAAYIAGKARIAEAPDNLMKLLADESASDSARSEAAIALGRLEWKPARPLLLSTIRKQFVHNRAHGEILSSCLYSFFEMKDSMASADSLSMLNTCLDERNCPDLVLQYNFFYLKSLRIKTTPEMSFKYLNSRETSVYDKCYAADVLRFTASSKDITAMKAAFEQADSRTTCPVVYRKFHVEAPVILFEQDPMRALFVRAVGNLKEDSEYDWIWMIGSNTAENMQTRKVAEMYARALQKK